MKILLVAQTFAPQKEGGAEIVARRIADALSHRHELRVLSLALPGVPLPEGAAGEPVIDRLAYHGAWLPEVGKRPDKAAPARLLWHGRNAVGGVRAGELADYLADYRPDVIYAHNSTAFQPQLGRLAKAMSIPMVQHLHDYALLCPGASMYRRGRNCARQCTMCRLLTSRWRAAMREPVSDAVAVSSFVRDRLRGAGVLPTARWHVLHNVEPPERLAAYARAPRHAGAPFTFGFLGALTPEKGIDALLEAFAALPAGRARLLVGGVGAQDYSERLIAASGPTVEWRGHVDPNALLAETDALVVPSLWHEPQGLVVIEGVGRGLIVVGSDCGGITEVLRAYSRGILYDPDRPGALQAALQAAMALAKGDGETATDPGPGAAHGGPTGAYMERIEKILFGAVHQ